MLLCVLSREERARDFAADGCDCCATIASYSGFLSDAGQVSDGFMREVLRRESLLRPFGPAAVVSAISSR